MPSKSVGGRKPAGGFDSRPPPLSGKASDQPLREEAGVEGPREEGRSERRTPRPPHKSFGVLLRATPDKSSDRPPEDRTSLAYVALVMVVVVLAEKLRGFAAGAAVAGFFWITWSLVDVGGSAARAE